jgi:dienelactone hydrolase
MRFLMLGSLSWLAALAACAPPATRSEAEPPTASVAPSTDGTAASDLPNASAASGPEQILTRPDLAAYHGWVRYLMFRAEHAEERFGKGSERARHEQAELASWTQRIVADPALLTHLRGVIEWAYVSPVDGSGQPFKLNIPMDYDPARPAPLSLYMHGYSGNHLEHAAFMKERSGDFEMSVLGRSRGGRYRALSEADVLGALDYVEAHWSVDPNRVHLTGGSMGGGGTFWLGSRYPQRFASGRPVCGFGSDLPIENLLTFPIYATHSDDDYTVPVLHARGPLGRLRELGGNATLDETTGLGHNAWDYTEGNQRGAAWYVKQVRPSSHDVKRLTYRAIDGRATRDYWAEVAEWGPQPEPARFALEVGAKNQIDARLHNIARLSIRVGEAPLDRQAPLAVVVNGAKLVHAAPLPDVLGLALENGKWAWADAAPSLPFRLHTPGGANQLYTGEPLLIVYGTAGGADVTAALKNAAVVASHSSNAAWPSPNGELGDDGVSHNQNLYGDLPIAADVDVTADALATHHLVLLGTASQNSLVARMAERLPVRLERDELRFSDGAREPASDSAVGLVHFNPLAPARLVFWVASNDPAYYRADALVPQVLGTFPTGADLVVSRVSEPSIVAARSFDSRWRWVARAASPTLPAAAADRAVFARALAESARRAVKADFALALQTAPGNPSYANSLHVADVAGLLYYEPISVMTLTGAELDAARQTLASKKPEALLQPQPPARLDPKATYRVALTARQISPLVSATHLAPKRYVMTDQDIASALLRSGFIQP